MGGEVKLEGPDLAAGVAAEMVREGESLVGHAGGEAVLVTRSQGTLRAVGASCTHYGGPLGDGLVENGRVHCPWHHACFDLATGEPHGPAITPLPCYAVSELDGKVIVGARFESPRAAPRTSVRRIVILGAGAAGGAAADALRRGGFAGEVTMVGDDGAPVDRPNLSKDILAGTAPEEWVWLKPPSSWSERRVTLRRERATAIDVAGRRLLLDGAEPLPWDALLIATGAEPVRLAIPGGERALVLRSLDDCRAIVAAAAKGKRAVIIGSSFIGLEVAASLRARDVDVRVVGPDARPLARVLGPELGAFVQSLHEQHGVRFHLGRRPSAIEPDAVVLDDGTRLPADLVVAGIGVRPRLALAEQAGLAIDRGIVVDEFLPTSAPGIYAAGDVARFPDPRGGPPIRVEHWTVAVRQGQLAARNLVGNRETYRSIPFFWSQHYDVSVSYVGHAEAWDRIEVDGDLGQRDAAVRYFAGGKLLALATVFRDRESLEVEVQMEREHG